MRNQEHVDLIGLGVYTLQEASLYSGILANKLSRWVFGAGNCLPVIHAQLSSQHVLSFYDLVQTMAIDSAKKEGVSLQKIREAINNIKTEYGLEFPLAYNHKLILFDRDLHIQIPNKGIIQVSGKQKWQEGMKEIIEPFMKDLRFDKEGIANLFIPFEKYGKQIILDPKRQFGQPLVEGTGYRADVLNESHRAERSFGLVASLYGIEVNDVRIAVAYMHEIRRKVA